ncbi:MAG: M56 family metallopeptidase [Oscillospiraceae bacterium]|nr:M56 family metallopeptidase [Oscillospiraceae bacterium]
MISRYSIIIAIILFNLSIIIIAIMRRRTNYLVKYSTLTLVVLALLGVLRMVIPMSFPFTYVIQSFRIYPAIVAALDRPLWAGGMLTTQRVILLVWGVGSAIMLVRTVIMLCKVYEQRSKYALVESAQVKKMVEKLQLEWAEVIVSPDVGVPFVTGLFKARIYLPNMEMSDDVLEVILRHEYQHFKLHDLMIKVFYFVLSVLFWWNPIVHTFQRELDKLLEIRCDMALLATMNEEEKTLYLEALASVVTHTFHEKPVAEGNALALVKSGQPGFMDQRIEIILNSGELKSKRMRMASVVVVVALFFASYFVTIQPAHEVPADYDYFTISPENAHIVIAPDGRFWLHIDGLDRIELDEDGVVLEVFGDILTIVYEEEIT